MAVRPVRVMRVGVADRLGRRRNRGETATGLCAHLRDDTRAALTVVVMGVLHRVSGRNKRGRRHYRLAGLGRLAPRETLYHPPMTAPRSAATQLDPREAKRSLRERVVQARDALPMATRVRYADTIIARVRAREDFQSARTVLLSLAFRSEWETRPLFNAALALGKTLVVPRVNLGTRMLDLYAIGDLFDAWLGDDQLREPLPAAVAAAFAELEASGTPIYLHISFFFAATLRPSNMLISMIV